MESNTSLWSATATSPTFPPLMANAEVDVVIVGGGITGLTAAFLLASAGQRVSLVEARRIGSGVSSRSTVHLTEAVDTRYQQIESDFGREGAKLVAQSSRAAIEKVADLVKALSIPCDFLRRPGFLYTEKDEDLAVLRDEYEAARRAGLPVDLLPESPLPFVTKGALRFPDQAQMHVARYLASVATAAQAKGAQIYEDSRVITIEDGEPCIVHLEHGPAIRAKNVLVATHAPLNRVFLQTKIAAYRSYVLAFANVKMPDGLFWDTEDPYHYSSAFTVDGVSYLIVGGEDHKTGTETSTDERFDRLFAWTKARIAVPAPSHRWSAQVEEPVDGLPFIGRNALSEHVYVATGFSGNGITFGTVAAMILTDLVVARVSPWADLYSATRVKPVSSAGTYLEENIDFPMHLVSDRLHPPEAKSPADIRPGEGKTIRLRGERLAVYRDPQGALHAVSSVCTHLGCLVKFNNAEKTWDCPCHGSRFGVDGAVLDGPATRPLAKKSLETRHASGMIDASKGVDAADRGRTGAK
jgi:glycine/D-amino acid oxidase-like deaminating enzyme/nitrite reductase/ring-hydroxylating ferredoxin subunit